MKKRTNFIFIRQAFIIYFIILVSWCHLRALSPGKSTDRYILDSWEITNGFPSNEVTSTAQTPDGYLWFATSKGLVRFDGITFTMIFFTKKEEIFPLETPIPLKLFVNRNGTLWIGSSTGLTSYNHRDGCFRTYTTANGLSANRVSCLSKDIRDNLWIGYMGGYVDCLTNGTFTSFNETHGLQKGINAIVEDHKGNLLFATRENGVFEYRDGGFTRYNIAGLDNLQLYVMFSDGNGVLWIGTDNGLFRVNNKTAVRYTKNEGLPGNKITTILKDREQNLWVGTLEGGLVMIKKTGDGNMVFEQVPGTEILKILYLFEDKENSLWISTLDSGIKRLKDGKFASYPPLEPYRDEIFLSIFQDNSGYTWSGTYSGKLFHCKESELLEISNPRELSGSGITAIEEDKESNLWLGTNGKGLFRKNKGVFTRFTIQDGLTDNKVNSIYCDLHGNLWICTANGICVKYPHRDVFKSLNMLDGLAGKSIHDIGEDKTGRIRIATESGILILSNGFSPTFFQEGGPPDVEIKSYLAGVSITCIYEDPDISEEEGPIYWAASNGAGLKRLRLKDGKITHYTTAHGLVTNVIYRFFEDRDKNFWLMSNSGILRVGKNELNRFAYGQVEYLNCISYGIADGMKSPEFNNELSRHSALRTANGEFLFVTKKGISIINPDQITINKTKPQVVIEQVWFDRAVVSGLVESKSYTFKGIRDIKFQFTAPTFLSPEKIKFKYQISGIDKKWVYLPPGKERIALYEDVEAGTYTFTVTACNAEGIWNTDTAKFSFTLKPLFYQTLIFKILLLILFIGLVCVTVYIYKKRPFDKKIKYKGSSLNDQFAEVCIRRLKHKMQVEKVYRDENITLQSLADKISIPSHVLSRILNEKLNINFSDYINYHRIEEAKEILMSSQGNEKKISAIAYDVGFNALTVFYKAFNKFTGKTPGQYKKDKPTNYHD